VFPSANHTRFEHSLGVYHLACQALSGLDVDERAAAHARAAALLHDVGHGPYGHQTEDLSDAVPGWTTTEWAGCSPTETARSVNGVVQRLADVSELVAAAAADVLGLRR